MNVYFIDPLPGDRGQMMCDVLDEHGNVVSTHRVGSPGPRADIERVIRVLNLRRRDAD